MNILTGIKKQKKKKILILSASGQNKGLQTQYIELHGQAWSIINDRIIKYSDEINEFISKIKNEESKISIKTLSTLDYHFSDFLVSTAKDLLSSMPLGKKKPDLIVLNKLTLWSGKIDLKDKLNPWVYTIGNPAYLASKTGFPVISDFLEKAISEKRNNFLPILNGDIILSNQIEGPSLFVNLGLNSRLTIIKEKKVAIDLECGPATILIDMVAEKIGLNQGFDRDGNEALNGNADISLIEYLLDQSVNENDDFSEKFKKLLNTVKLKRLSSQDLLATITAFVALKIFDSYRNNYTDSEKPKDLWISGGGTNNLALIDYLKNYFAPIQVKNVENLGITGNNRLPLSLALSVNCWIDGEDIILPPEVDGSIKNIGNWYLP